MSRLGGKVVEMKKVYKSYGDKPILKGFDYTFSKGERIGVIGKNGVGKSTFLNILQGLETADSGKVNIGETVIFGNFSQQGLEIKDNMRVIEYVKSFAESFPLAKGGSLQRRAVFRVVPVSARKAIHLPAIAKWWRKKEIAITNHSFSQSQLSYTR